jgi:hypothetical protein
VLESQAIDEIDNKGYLSKEAEMTSFYIMRQGEILSWER